MELRKKLNKAGKAALLLMFATALCLPISQEAYAWDSYKGEGLVWWFTDPLHEDMTQMAYVRLIQQAYADQYPDTSNLLYAATQDEYAERLQYLRQGAVWNDVPANNIIEFGANYPSLIREDIASHNDPYTSAYDIGVHLSETTKYLDDSYEPMARSMVRMSHNRRGNILHAMLGSQADGKSYLTQQQQKDFSLQWLKVVYKYARGDALDENEKKLISFIDPYSQIKDAPTSPWGDDADREMTTTQGRLRALGMMCHTIEDSYNPAHTIRSYHGDQVGPILAFGVYEVQSLHKDYDHMNSKDGPLRSSFVSATETLQGAKDYLQPAAAVSSLTTLGLKDSSNAAYMLLEHFYKGDSWEDIEPWLRDEVFATAFNNGDSSIYEGGRRAGDLNKLQDKAASSAAALKKLYPNQTTLLEDMKDRYRALVQYQKELNGYYHGSAYDGSYHIDSETEGQGRVAAQTAIDDIYDVLQSNASELSTLLAKMSPTDRATLQKLVKDTNGIIQEFGLDLDDALDSSYDTKAAWIIGALAFNGGTVTGAIESVSGNEFVLRQSNGNGSLLFSATAEICSALAVGQQNVAVDYTMIQPDGVFYYYDYVATNVSVPTGDSFLSSKGIVKDITADSIVVTIEGGLDDYVFSVAGDSQTFGIAVGDRIDVSYVCDAHSLMLYDARTIEGPDRNLLPLNNVPVVAYYGNVLLIEVADESGLPLTVGFEYAEADFIGDLSIGALVDILYYDNGQKLYDLDLHDDTVVNAFEASRIKVVSHDGEHAFIHVPNDDATHQKICVDLDASILERCTLGDNGTCTECGYQFKKFTVSGKVTDKETKEVARAVLQLCDAQGNACNTAVSVDINDGRYTITEVYEGYDYTLEVACYGYRPQTSVAFNVIKGNVLGMDFELEATAEPMYDFTVSGRVTNEATGMGIPAVVQLKDSLGEAVGPLAMADSNGYYVIKEVLPSAGYTVAASMIGYVTRSSSPFDIVFTNATDVDIPLSQGPVVNPILTEGDASLWKRGSTDGLLFVSSARYDAYQSVSIDGKRLVGGVDCEVSAGSIRVLVRPTYLEALSDGDHAIVIHSLEGDADGVFTVATDFNPVPNPTPNPKPGPHPKPVPVPTGDSLPVLFVVSLAILAASCLVVVSVKLRRKG